jgi:hypothetical protein
MNWSHPLVLVVASAITATVITLVVDVFLKPTLEPRIEARVEGWKHRRHVIGLTEKWKAHWDDRDEFDGLVGPGEVKGADSPCEELSEFRFQHHHRSKREAVVAKSLTWALAEEEEWHNALDEIGLMDVRNEILNCGCAYLTTPRRRWVKRNRVYQEHEDWRRVLREEVDKENVDIPLP